MTVPTTDFETTYFADGSTVDFDFTFRVITKESVVVVNITDAVTLTYGTDYTVVLESDGVGGTVTLNAPQDDGDELHIYRLEDYFQELDLITQQDLKAEVIETALDKATIQIQQLNNTNNFILETVIPGLEEQIDDILDLSGTVLKTGTPAIGSIPVWTVDNPATLGSGLAPGADDTIIKASGGQWVVSTGIPVLDLGTVTVPGTTDQDGLVYWDATDGTALGTIAPGINGEVLAGVTGAPSDFKPILEVIGDLTSTAGHVLTSNGTGVDASFQAVPAAPVLADSFFGPTSKPVGMKTWFLAKPGAYVIGGARNAKTSGTSSDAANANGSYLVLTTTASINKDVYVYTTTDDLAARRDSLPIWITRILTGAAVTNIRMWIGFNCNERNAMRAGSAPTGSTAAFRYDTGADGTAFWRFVTCDAGGTTTTTTTTVAVTAATDYVMAIDMSESGHVKALIDGVQVADHTTNLPDATDFLDWLIICRTLTASVKSIGVSVVNMSHR